MQVVLDGKCRCRLEQTLAGNAKEFEHWLLKNKGSAECRDARLNSKDIFRIKDQTIQNRFDVGTSVPNEQYMIALIATGRGSHLSLHACKQAHAAATLAERSKEANDGDVFYYQPKLEAGPGQLCATPFVLGITEASLLRHAAECSNGQALQVDATHGTTQYKVVAALAFHASLMCGDILGCHTQVQLYTVLATDGHGHGLPMAWILSDSGVADHIAPALQALFATVLLIKPD